MIKYEIDVNYLAASSTRSVWFQSGNVFIFVSISTFVAFGSDQSIAFYVATSVSWSRKCFRHRQFSPESTARSQSRRNVAHSFAESGRNDAYRTQPFPIAKYHFTGSQHLARLARNAPSIACQTRTIF